MQWHWRDVEDSCNDTIYICVLNIHNNNVYIILKCNRSGFKREMQSKWRFLSEWLCLWYSIKGMQWVLLYFVYNFSDLYPFKKVYIQSLAIIIAKLFLSVNTSYSYWYFLYFELFGNYVIRGYWHTIKANRLVRWG